MKQPEWVRGTGKSPELRLDAGKLPGRKRTTKKRSIQPLKFGSVNEALPGRALANKFAHISGKPLRWTKRMWPQLRAEKTNKKKTG